ncbi:MAG: PspC domain-containing protein [Bacteroidota bacterium]
MTENVPARRLYKSRTDRMLDGICGGVAEYLGLDSTLIRLATVLLAIFGGVGIVIYIVAMIIMPTNPSFAPAADAPAAPARTHERNSKFWGILLIVVGTLWFLGNLGVPIWHHWWGFSWDILFPVLLILAGVAFIFGGRNSLHTTTTFAPAPQPPPLAGSTVPPKRLTKSRTERKIAGVCGGIAAYFDVDPTLVRLLVVVAAFASFGFVLLAYIIMAIVVPQEKPAPA